MLQFPIMIDAAVVYTLLFISLYFEVFLLVAFLERRFRTVAFMPALTKLPSVCIVVPCYNEERTVATTLLSLLSLDYESEKLEILVVDDGSTDGTLRTVEAFVRAEGASGRIKILHKDNGGKHTAMNVALAHTNPDLIGCLDADSEVVPGALKAAVAAFANERVAAVTPGIHNKRPESILQWMQYVEYRLSIFTRFMLAQLGSAYITPGAFSLFRTEVIRQLGGWRHGHSTEDLEMALRMQRHGYMIANAPGAIVYTATPKKFSALFRQRVRWNYGFLRNATDYRDMFFNKNYGNLGLIVLPLALLSIGTGLFFFVRMVYWGAYSLAHVVLRTAETGIFLAPSPSLSWLYAGTSVMWFLIYMSVVLMLVLIYAGTVIGTSERIPPLATPLFLMFYSFLAPLWLGTALVRAVFKTGVRWR